MKQNVRTTAMMTVLFSMLLISSIIYTIPVSAQSVTPLLGTWTLTFFPVDENDNPAGDPINHIMIINFDDGATFAGIGRRTNILGVTWDIEGTYNLEDETVSFILTYTDINTGYQIFTDTGNILTAQIPLKICQISV